MKPELTWMWVVFSPNTQTRPEPVEISTKPRFGPGSKFKSNRLPPLSRVHYTQSVLCYPEEKRKKKMKNHFVQLEWCVELRVGGFIGPLNLHHKRVEWKKVNENAKWMPYCILQCSCGVPSLMCFMKLIELQTGLLEMGRLFEYVLISLLWFSFSFFFFSLFVLLFLPVIFSLQWNFYRCKKKGAKWMKCTCFERGILWAAKLMKMKIVNKSTLSFQESVLF